MSEPTPAQLAQGARDRMQRAQDHIEAAQSHLNSATAELSGLIGCINTWTAAGKLSDRVKGFWYRVDNQRNVGRYRLDALCRETLRKRLAALASKPAQE